MGRKPPQPHPHQHTTLPTKGAPIPAQPLPHDTALSARKHVRYDSALLIALVPVALATFFCIGHLDIAVAEFVRRYLYASKGWRHFTSSIPDALLILVVCVTAGSHALFRYRASHYGIDAAAVMYKMLAAAAPASYIVKSFLKYAFGRINTREWLHAPQEYGFHWFSGAVRYSGFPSGHMLVVTALVAVVWRFHPRYRPACVGLLLVLALAMIVTNYHFVSDVIAGTYVGLVVEACTWRVVGRKYR
jgi:membrane-associated phospholipid phosphatase